MDAEALRQIADRWDGVSNGHRQLSFEAAKADMQALLAEVRKQEQLRRRIAELEAHVRKRNNDLAAFASEVARLANGKYSDWSAPQPPTPSAPSAGGGE